MSFRSLTILVLLLLTLPGTGVAWDNFRVSVLGELTSPDDAEGVAVQNDIAYVTVNNEGLWVVDVSDPAAPVEISLFPTSTPANDVVVVGDFAYVAALDGGLRILDVTDPTALVEVSSIYEDAEFWVYSLIVENEHAFLVTSDGLAIVDVSDPVVPSERSFYVHGNVIRDIALVGDYGFLAGSYFGLIVLDLSDYTNPVEIDDFDTPGSALGISVVGDFAYIASRYQGLMVFDISDPTAPFSMGHLALNQITEMVTAVGERAFVSSSGEFFVVDISIPYAPKVAGHFLTDGAAEDIFVSGETAYVGDSNALRVMDCSAAINDPVSVTLTPTGPTDIPHSGGTLAFDVSVVNNTPQSIPNLMFWTRVKLPNGTFYPNLLFQTTFTLQGEATVSGSLTQVVPTGAPSGDYQFMGWVGMNPFSGVQMGDYFTFRKGQF